MIARREHPEQPGKYVYVPLRMMASGIWVPIGGERVMFYEALGAGMTCAEDLRCRYVEIAKQARIVRALCEHPQFKFTGDGVDSDMVRESARELSRLVAAEFDNVTRLLSDPLEDDDIVIGGVTYDVDEEEELIEERIGDRRRWPPPGSPEADPPMPKLPKDVIDVPPELLLQAARCCLAMADQTLGDARSSVEVLRNWKVAAPEPMNEDQQADAHSASERKDAESAEGTLDDESPSFVLWAARTYIRLTQQVIQDAVASITALRKQMESPSKTIGDADEM